MQSSHAWVTSVINLELYTRISTKQAAITVREARDFLSNCRTLSSLGHCQIMLGVRGTCLCTESLYVTVKRPGLESNPDLSV